jgi:acyl-CoA synthetase (AMP-forming)/AMP-acid ligase II
MLVQDFLQQSASARPEKIALICGEREFTYARLDEMANKLAFTFSQHGVKRGDRVAIYLANSPEAVVSIFGTLKAGCVFVAVNRAIKFEKLVSILKDAGATFLVTDARAAAQGRGERLLQEAASLKGLIVCEGHSSAANGHGRVHDFATIQTGSAATPPVNQNIDLDLACLIYTSGTTGESKGVMCDHSNVVFVTQAIVEYLENNSNDIILSVLPLAFSYGLYQLLATFATGGTLVLEESFAFPAVVLQKMSDRRVTGFAGVPTIYSILLGMDLARVDLSALRYLTNAAAGLPIEHVKRLRQLLPKVNLYLMHGLTEVARTMYLPPSQIDARPGSSGIAMPGTELWIEDEEGRRLGPGQTGELVVRGRHVMRGYWQAPELSALRFRSGPFPGERICYSGDLFRTDEDGYFYFVSRKDDIIKSRGEKIAPREVEHVLYGIPGVQDAAVIGVPDPTLGQIVKAFIVAPGVSLTEAAVISHCKSRLEEVMVPRQVVFIAELPKTGSGKLRRMDLR